MEGIMVRSWLKLEAVEAIQDRQQHYLKHLEQLMTLYPTSGRLKELYYRCEVLEQDILELTSRVDCRIYVGNNLVEFARNPLESNDRFQLETERKNTLFLALRHFRAEPEFKSLNESLEDPSSAEAKELGKKNMDLEAKIEALKQIVSQERGNQQHSLRQLNDLRDERNALKAEKQRLDSRILDLNGAFRRAQVQNVGLHSLNQRQIHSLDINEETISALQAEFEVLTNKLQTADQEKDEAMEAKREAEKATTHAQANHESIRKAFDQSDGRVLDLNKQISELQRASKYWREEHRKSHERVLDLNKRLDQQQLRAPVSHPRNHIPDNSPTTNTSSRTVSNSSPIPEVSKEKAYEKLFAQAADSRTFSGPSASSGSSHTRNTTRVTSGSGSQVQQSRPSLTVVQTRVANRMAKMTDMQLESLEPAMKELEELHPGEHYHWVRGHWARDPNTKAFETAQDLQRKNSSHYKLK